MSLQTLKSIENAIKLVDAKKRNLKEAFENLKSHTSKPSLNVTWDDLDSYFTSFETHVIQSFSNLQSQTLKLNPNSELNLKKDTLLTELVPARPELKSLCEKNDGLGLRSYVIERPKERPSIRVELVDAFRYSSDPGSMVLDALDGFWDVGSDSIAKVRTACVVLLEEFMRTGFEVGSECRSRAGSMAIEWKRSILCGSNENFGDGDGEELTLLGYLQLLAAYRLLGDGVCNVDEVVDCVARVSRFRQAMYLCRKLGIQNRVSDVVKRLISKGKQLSALKFIFEFEITDEFPPVALLKDYLMNSKKNAQQVRENGKHSSKSMNEAAVKEINALKSVIKFIDDHGLESEYPKGELLTHLQKLEKEKAGKKRPATTTPLPKGKNPSERNGNKRVKASSGIFRQNVNHAKPLSSQPSAVNRANVLPNHTAPYLTSISGAYGLVASNPQLGSDPYGLSGAHTIYYGNPNRSGPNTLHTQQQPVYHGNCTVGHSGADVASQYHHQVYYPQ